jgi:signal peptidase I
MAADPGPQAEPPALTRRSEAEGLVGPAEAGPGREEAMTAQAGETPSGIAAAGVGQGDGDGWQGLGRQLLSLLLWVVVALLLRALVVEPRWIPSGSMLPSLRLQDRILVEKLRPRLGAELRPGTVVVFHPPASLLAAGYDPDAALIKRVVAGPGQTVAVRGGRLLRDGEPLHPDWSPVRIDYQLEPFIVPEGTLWVMGDNRNASLDSHVWGPLPREEVIGTAIWRYWPLSRFGPIRFSPNLPPGSG